MSPELDVQRRAMAYLVKKKPNRYRMEILNDLWSGREKGAKALCLVEYGRGYDVHYPFEMHFRYREGSRWRWSIIAYIRL